MTQEDKIALKEFLIGTAVAIGITTVLLLTIFASGILTTETTKEQRFQVVDEYKGCDVVQYSPSSTSTYKYFLDCRK